MNNTPREQALGRLRAAQQELASLDRVPDADNYALDTIVRWSATPREGQVSLTYVAVKTQWGWAVSGRTGYMNWDQMQSVYFRVPLDFFDVAPEDWHDATLHKPQVEVVGRDHRGRLVIEYDGGRWRYSPTYQGWVHDED